MPENTWRVFSRLFRILEVVKLGDDGTFQELANVIIREARTTVAK